MAEMLQGAIYQGPTSNFQGKCKSSSLRTGRRITRKKFTPLPMLQSVINQVEDMNIKEDCNEDLIFTDIDITMMPIHTTFPQEWITTIIIIKSTMQPMKTAQITNNTVQPMKMVPEPTQPMKTAPTIYTILQKIMNKRW